MNMDQLDEPGLIALLKQGSEDAFRHLVSIYRQKLFAIAYGITLDREESLDIVQEVFLQVHRNIHSFRGAARLSTWLHRITVNQCLNWRRKWKRRMKWRHDSLEEDESVDQWEPAEDENFPETLYHRKEIQKIVREKLARLPEDARAVLVLKEIEGLSYDEIARVLNIKRGTVSSRLFHARGKLKASLKKYMDEDN